MRIIIVPGWKETIAEWQTVYDMLAAVGFDVVFITYPTPENEELDVVLERFQEHFTTKCIMVGSSVGARAIIHQLHRRNHQVVGAVLFACPSLPFVGVFGKIVYLFGRLLRPFLFLIPRRIRKKVTTLFISWSPALASRAHYRRVISAPQDTLLPLIKVPVKLVWGGKDRVTSPAIGEKMTKLMPDSDLVIVDRAKHQIYRYDPTLAANIIDAFAREH